MTDISTHYLTQRQTGMDQEQQQDMLFQLTTSRRGRPGQRKRSHAARHFNSLPHAEVDGRVWKSSGTTCISTHYLTQRQTEINKEMGNEMYNFNSLPHAEVDYIRNAVIIGFIAFQLTTSRRGRQSFDHSVQFFQCISTHYLTQRQTLSQASEGGAH